MSSPMPGVEMSNNLVTLSMPANTSAVPVFIGYTQSGLPRQLVAISSWEALLTAFFPADPVTREASALYQSLRLYFDNGGNECYVLAAGLITDIDANVSTIAQQLIDTLNSAALRDDNTVTLLCMPDIVLLAQQQDQEYVTYWGQVWQAMLTASRARLGGFALLDLPSAPADASRVLKATISLTDADAEFGAVYWPHLVCTYRKVDSTPIIVPTVGAVAAQVQRTDRQHGVWKAPANEALQQVIKPQYAPREGDDVFASATPVNLIRSFAGRGVRIWGCQTLTRDTTSPFRFVQVRRLLGYVETRLSALARFCVFEPNNEITWLKLKSLGRSWLRSLWLNGVFYGATEDEAFRLYVGLDESMTADDVLAGRLILSVELSALYPAEYIRLSLSFTMMETQMRKEQA